MHGPRAVAALLLWGALVAPQGVASSQPATDAVPVSWAVTAAPAPNGERRANFVLDAEPGEHLEDSLLVENLGDVELVLGVYASDAFNTANGGVDLLAADEPPTGLGAWVHPESPSITVAPGERVEVPFTIDVPDDAAPGDHAGGIVTSLTVRDSAPDGTRVAVERRLGTRIYVRVDGALRPELTYTEMAAHFDPSTNPLAPGSMRLTYRVENTGNVRLRATRSATVDPAFGPSSSDEASDMAELLPGNSYELTQTVPGVWPAGSTRSEVELAPYEPAGGDAAMVLPAVRARTTTSLFPWGQLVVVAVCLMAMAWRLRRHRS